MPSTLMIDPQRTRLPRNEEQPIHPFYGYVYVTDREEGLIVVKVTTLLDGNPENNFLSRSKLKDAKGTAIGDHFNPNGVLKGAEFGICAGYRMYICTKRGLAVVDLNNPEQPKLVGELGRRLFEKPEIDRSTISVRIGNR